MPAAVSEKVWQLSWASVLGKSHQDAGLPNQDGVQVRTSEDGRMVCAVVSDGAGTAARSDEGSAAATRILADTLCEFCSDITSADSSEQQTNKAQRYVSLGIQRFHEHIKAIIKRDADAGIHTDKRAFHCTMVAWLQTPGGAFIAQVGDSVGLSTRFDWVDQAGKDQADFFPDGQYTLHDVERGEYANETHFITEPDWRAHLRIHRLPEQIDAIALMTDGAMDVVMLRGRVFRGFLSNLVGKLMATPDATARCDTIHAWLGSPQTFGVTGDDKTLLMAIRQDHMTAFSRQPIYLGPPPPPPAPQRVPPHPGPKAAPLPAPPAPVAPPPPPPIAAPIPPVSANAPSSATSGPQARQNLSPAPLRAPLMPTLPTLSSLFSLTTDRLVPVLLGVIALLLLIILVMVTQLLARTPTAAPTGDCPTAAPALAPYPPRQP